MVEHPSPLTDACTRLKPDCFTALRRTILCEPLVSVVICRVNAWYRCATILPIIARIAMRNRCSVFVITAALLFSTNVRSAQAALYPGDKVDVQVYNHPELSGVRTLDAMGNVSVPVAGSVAAANLEPRDVAARIRARLAPYVRGVAVAVRLDTQSESIFVAGGPGGSVKFVPGETLSSVVDRLQTTHVTPQAQTADNAAVVRGADAVDLYNGGVDFRKVSI